MLMNFMKNAGPCYRCKRPISIPGELYDAASTSPRISFWCAYGHEQHFAEGETEEQKLRRERDNLKQQQARLEDEKREAIARAEKAEAATKRLKRRTAAGTCPCCQRTFSNMSTHMRKQHPQFVAEQVVVPLKRA